MDSGTSQRQAIFWHASAYQPLRRDIRTPAHCLRSVPHAPNVKHSSLFVLMIFNNTSHVCMRHVCLCLYYHPPRERTGSFNFLVLETEGSVPSWNIFAFITISYVNFQVLLLVTILWNVFLTHLARPILRRRLYGSVIGHGAQRPPFFGCPQLQYLSSPVILWIARVDSCCQKKISRQFKIIERPCKRFTFRIYSTVNTSSPNNLSCL
jgi:hypothetical protein